MKTFEIIIYSWKKQLFNRFLVFNNVNEAQNYALGLYEAFSICQQEPTGLSTREIEN